MHKLYMQRDNIKGLTKQHRSVCPSIVCRPNAPLATLTTEVHVNGCGWATGARLVHSFNSQAVEKVPLSSLYRALQVRGLDSMIQISRASHHAYCHLS